jgi:hypothetical protein
MSTIKFDHSQKEFHLAIGIDDEQRMTLMETLAGISAHMVKEEPSKSKVAEMLATTLSYKELLLVATEGMEAKTKDALEKYVKFTKLAEKRGLDMDDKDEIIKAIKEVVKRDENDEDDAPSIKSICIDPDDIDGSLDRANVPDEFRDVLKSRIISEIKRRIRKDE